MWWKKFVKVLRVTVDCNISKGYCNLKWHEATHFFLLFIHRKQCPSTNPCRPWAMSSQHCPVSNPSSHTGTTNWPCWCKTRLGEMPKHSCLSTYLLLITTLTKPSHHWRKALILLRWQFKRIKVSWTTRDRELVYKIIFQTGYEHYLLKKCHCQGKFLVVISNNAYQVCQQTAWPSKNYFFKVDYKTSF